MKKIHTDKKVKRDSNTTFKKIKFYIKFLLVYDITKMNNGPRICNAILLLL